MTRVYISLEKNMILSLQLSLLNSEIWRKELEHMIQQILKTRRFILLSSYSVDDFWESVNPMRSWREQLTSPSMQKMVRNIIGAYIFLINSWMIGEKHKKATNYSITTGYLFLSPSSHVKSPTIHNL